MNAAEHMYGADKRRRPEETSIPEGQRMQKNTEKPKWRPRVPWVAKLRPDLRPKVVVSPRGRGTMLVPTPLLVAEEVRRVRRGRLVTPAELRRRLAIRFGADQTCPPTMGILLHIVAGAAEEQLAVGRRPVAPYWRVVDEQGALNPRTPPGSDCQAAHLRREGHVVRRMAGSGRLQVVDPESAGVRLRTNARAQPRSRAARALGRQSSSVTG